MNKKTIVPWNHRIIVEGFCPWCDGDAVFVASGFEISKGDLWKADGFRVTCSYMPEKGSETYNVWSQIHRRAPLDAAQKRVWDRMPKLFKVEYRFYLHS